MTSFDSGVISRTVWSGGHHHGVTSSLLIVTIVLNRVVGASYRPDYRPSSFGSSSSSHSYDAIDDGVDDDVDEYQTEEEVRPNLLPTPTNITVVPGDRAILRCRVEYLGTKTVTWRRLGDIHPLTIGLFTFVSDTRVSAEHDRQTEDWSLIIDDAKSTDEGTYQCQINSKEDQTNYYNIHLHVSAHHTAASSSIRPIFVTGTSTVERGGPIHLVCNATWWPERGGSPAHWVEWIKDNRRLASDPDQGLIVTQRTEKAMPGRAGVGSGGGVVSVLAIRRSKATDAGEYRCRSSENESAAIRVSVLNASLEKRGTSVDRAYTQANTANIVSSRQFFCCNFIRSASPLISTSLTLLSFAGWLC